MANHWVVNVDTKVMIASFDDAGKATCSIGSDQVWLEAPEGVSAGNCKVVVETPAVAAVPEVPEVPEVLNEDGSVLTPAVPAVPGVRAIPAVLKLVDGSADKASPVWKELRKKRDALLAECDWTQMPDVALAADKKAAWVTYRTQLRDIPDNTAIPESVTWPVKP